MSAPRISNTLPKLRTKALNSGYNIHNGEGQKGNNEDNQIVGKNGIFSYLCDSSNTFYPLNSSFAVTNSDQDKNKEFPNGDQMFASNDFNVIKVELNTTKTDNEQAINLYYSNDGDFKNAVRKYRTVVPSNYQFYRNYPVENQYFSIGVENLGNVDDTIPSEITGSISLSRYTQYNAPVQSQDIIDRYVLADSVRNTNNFLDDVVLSSDQNGSFKRLADVKPVSIMGITSSITYTTMFNWDEPSSFQMTSNTFTDMNLISDNISDLNAVFKVTGTGINGKRVEESITSSGTSNTTGLLQYNFIDSIDYVSGGDGQANVGNIRIRRSTNGETMCFSQAGSGRSTSLLRVMDEKESGVLKSITLSGRSGLLQKSIYELYKVDLQADGTYKKELLFNYFVQDGEVNHTFPLNVQLKPNSRVIGLIRSDATGSLLTGDSQFNATLDIHLYNIKPESVRRSKNV